MILPWGRSETNKGPVIVDEHTAAVLPGNQARIKRPTVKGDFEHQSALPAGSVKHPINYAVSSGVPKVVPGEGIVIEDAQWTEAGLRHVPTDYGDISAAPYRDAEGRVIALHSFAVCAHGEVDGVTIDPVTLSAELALLSADSNPTMDPTTTDPKKLIGLLAALLTACGQTVAEDASLEQLEAAVKAAETAKSAPAPDTLSADLKALRGELATYKADQTKALRKQDIARQVDVAIGAGKLVTLSTDDLLALPDERVTAYFDGLTAGVVPLSQRTPTTLSAGTSLKPVMDPDTAAALRDLGHDPDKLA